MHNTFEYFLAFESSGDRNCYTFKIKNKFVKVFYIYIYIKLVQ